MTIGVGFKCSDGIVLATDTQYTQGPIKTHGPKLFMSVDLPELAVVMAGAGSVHFMRRAAEELENAFKSLKPASTEDVRAAAEKALAEFYQRHIYPMPSERQENAGFQFIIGAWTPHGLDLYETQDATVVSAAEGYCNIGMGQYVTEYALGLTTGPVVLTVDKARLVAAFCVKAAKDYVEYCGGQTKIITLQNIPPHIKRAYPWEVTESEKYTTDLMTTVKDILQYLEIGPDVEFDDTMFTFITGALKDSIDALRAKRKERREAEEKARQKRLNKQNPAQDSTD
jgi:20S proteasome alpha/beta subunit